MPQVAREGDTCDHNGAPIAIEGVGINSTVTVNMSAVAITDGTGNGTAGPCGLWKENDPSKKGDDTHPLGESPTGIHPGIPGPTTGSDTVFVAGLPIHRFNDSRGCGAETITASPDVWADFVAKIRIEGATVQAPKDSPAAPKYWFYPVLEFFQFTSIGDGIFYVRTSDAEGKAFHNLKTSDFTQWGSTIVPTLEFEDVTDEDQFKVPDLDLATRKSPIPLSSVSDQFPNYEVNSSFVGLTAYGFPSFGELSDVENTGVIKGNGTGSTWWDFYTPVYDDMGDVIGTIPTGYGGYPFYIANESGNALSHVKLINIPIPPDDYFPRAN